MPSKTVFTNATSSTAVALTDVAYPISFEDAARKKEAIARALRRAARNARAPAGIISGGAGFHSRKGFRAFRVGVLVSFIACVICPVIGEAVYWGLIASKQYSTEMKFAIRTGEQSMLGGLAAMMGMGGSQTMQDTQILANYIRSRAMIDAVSSRIDLRKVYSTAAADVLARTQPDENIEDFESYWQKRVDVKMEAVSGIISVNVRAFTQEDAYRISSIILELSEQLVNELSTRARRDAVAQAQIELTRAEQRLVGTSTAMRDARNSEGVLDATAAAEAISKIITLLRLELARAEQDLASQGTATDSPQVRITKIRMGSIKNQIDDYSKEIAGVDGRKGSTTMADRLKLLSIAQTELDLARKNYAQASTMFQSARAEMERQQAYLVVSLRPTLAQKSTYPHRLWEWMIVVVPCLIGWILLVAIGVLVRDNMAK